MNGSKEGANRFYMMHFYIDRISNPNCKNGYQYHL